MMHSEDIGKLAEALAAAQGEMKAAPKMKTNPHFKSKYADLAGIWEACRGPLSKNGLAVIQTEDATDDGKAVVVTTLAHKSGQWVKSIVPLLVDRNGMQPLGSAITYARRYGLSSIVGIVADDDDDGEGATDHTKKDPPQTISRPRGVKRGEKDNGNARVQIKVPGKPAQILVPPGDNMSLVWRAWSQAIANCIANAGSAEEVNAWMDANESALNGLHDFSATGAGWAKALTERADLKRNALSQTMLEAG